MKRFFLLAVGLTAALWSAPAMAQDLDAQSALRDAIAALDAGDGDRADDLVRGSGQVAQDLVTWLRLREGMGNLPDYIRFFAKRPDWPTPDRLRREAELTLTGEEVPAEILAFFDGNDVETGQGAAIYAQALVASGEDAAADTMLIETWLTLGLTTEGHNAMIGAYADKLEPYHNARSDMLLWRWRTSDATNLLPLLDEGHRALIRARMGYIADAGDITERLALVPDRLKSDPGLLYDRFNWLADRGDWADASDLLLRRSTSAESLVQPDRWASWRRILARWNMREGNIALAYDLATRHHLTEGSNFADLEWLAGYLALTYLDDAPTALMHFSRLDAAVDGPISRGRAGYWLGRAHERLGNAVEAEAAYAAGARHQTSFYGLLAAERLGMPLDAEIAGGATLPDWQDGALLGNDLVEAALLLLAAGERGSAVSFVVEAAKTLPREDLAALGKLFLELDEPFYTILTAKAGVRRDILIQDIYFPIHPLGRLDLAAEPALSLAIARQESEFRIDAGSSVGALGIMQLMPATAQEVAGWEDVPFSRARLTTDWEYNARLGARYLAFLQEEFGPSPVMIAAGYNAGPSRPRTWMDERGDPRVRAMDVIDWIEHIPFRETRNYVMRVTEGMYVYRARLSGDAGPIAFTDLLIGAKPLIRPQARPEQVSQTVPVSRPATRNTSPTAPAAPQGIRPLPRPGDN